MPHVRAGSGTGVSTVGAVELASEADGVAQPSGIDLATAAVGAKAQRRRAAEVPLLAGVAAGTDRDV
jgi:hypothetical protein